MPDIPWTTGSVSSGGEDIYYEVAGAAGDVVVLCHGLGGNHAIWYQQVPVLARSYRVLTWDQRGFGRSTDRTQASGPRSAVADLGALLDHLSVDRAHLVGQSMGGWAVLGFALGSPGRVSSLVVADSIAGIVNEEIGRILNATTRRSVATDVIGEHAAIAPRTDVARTFLYQQIGGFRGDIADRDMIAKLLTTRYDLSEVRALATPALCIVGAEDDLFPPDAMKGVASVLGARLVEIAEAGHSPYFEHPDAWNTSVLEFFEKVA